MAQVILFLHLFYSERVMKIRCQTRELMLYPIKTTQFERDQKKLSKQRKNIKLLEEVILKLIKEEKLDPKHLDRPRLRNRCGRANSPKRTCTSEMSPKSSIL